MGRHVSLQQGSMAVSRATQMVAVPSAAAAAAAAATAAALRTNRASSPKAWTTSPHMQHSAAISGGNAPPRHPAPDETFVGGGPQSRAAPIGAVRSTSGNTKALSPTRQPPLSGSRGAAVVPHQAEECGGYGALHADCPSCTEIRRNRIFLFRLPCGHVARAQLMEEPPPTVFGHARSETPAAGHPGGCYEAASAVLPPRGHNIMRQVSALRSTMPSGGTAVVAGGAYPQAPLSPPRGGPLGGPAQPASPHQTPGSLYRIASSRALEEVSVEVPLPPQMTSRSSCSPVGGAGYPNAAVATQQSLLGSGGKALGATLGGRAALRNAPSFEALGCVEVAPRQSTVAEVVTDIRGDVLRKDTDVLLLLPPGTFDREQALKVRARVVGTYRDWDSEVGPRLDHHGEVQVMVTYVDPSERRSQLQFPTSHATTFGDTEHPDRNVIKWRASLCKVGKKFS